MKSAFVTHGARIAFNELGNQFKVWDWSSNSSSLAGETLTSISDGTEYVEICKNAFLYELVHRKYKSCTQYRDILEHCSYDLGLEYLKLIQANQKVLSNLRLVCASDTGSPFLYSYKGLGKASPTQIRYAKVLQDLQFLFGPLDNFIISEIGVGFGGQATQILASHSGITYRLFDLEWPSLLSRKNIALSPQGEGNTILISDWKSTFPSDLLISNYAFSELTRDTQELYMKNIVETSKKGYVIFNHLHDSHSDSLTAIEFAGRLQGSQIFHEIPLTFPGNVLVVWGHNVSALPNNLFVAQNL